MKIAVSILDCSDRIKGTKELNKTAASYIHVDVMDGKFVSEIHFQNISEVRKLSEVSDNPLDIHFMMNNPINYIKKLDNLNIKFITVHLETEENIHEIIKCVHDMGYKVGLSIKPNTDVREIESYLEEIDMILVMSVEPGLGGQKFMMKTVDRVHEVKELIKMCQRDIFIEVDGGINDETIQYLNEVDIAVVGSYVVNSDDYRSRINTLISNFKKK